MDTKTLVVGQDVYMFQGQPSPSMARKGRVKTITPEGVDVETVMLNLKDGTWNPHGVMHFDTNGKQPRHDSGIPWELDDMPYAERTAEIKQWYAEHPHLGGELRVVQDVQKIIKAGQVLMVRENKAGAREVSRSVFDELQAAGLLEEEHENTPRFIGLSCNLSPEEATVYKLRESAAKGEASRGETIHRP